MNSARVPEAVAGPSRPMITTVTEKLESFKMNEDDYQETNTAKGSDEKNGDYYKYPDDEDDDDYETMVCHWYRNLYTDQPDDVITRVDNWCRDNAEFFLNQPDENDDDERSFVQGELLGNLMVEDPKPQTIEEDSKSIKKVGTIKQKNISQLALIMSRRARSRKIATPKQILRPKAAIIQLLNKRKLENEMLKLNISPMQAPACNILSGRKPEVNNKQILVPKPGASDFEMAVPKSVAEREVEENIPKKISKANRPKRSVERIIWKIAKVRSKKSGWRVCQICGSVYRSHSKLAQHKKDVHGTRYGPKIMPMPMLEKMDTTE